MYFCSQYDVVTSQPLGLNPNVPPRLERLSQSTRSGRSPAPRHDTDWLLRIVCYNDLLAPNQRLFMRLSLGPFYSFLLLLCFLVLGKNSSSTQLVFATFLASDEFLLVQCSIMNNASRWYFSCSRFTSEQQLGLNPRVPPRLQRLSQSTRSGRSSAPRHNTAWLLLRIVF